MSGNRRSAYLNHVPGQPWTIPQLAAIADEWHNGVSLPCIAEQVGICTRSLRDALKRAGFTAPGQNSSLMAQPREHREQWRRQVERAYHLRAAGVMTWAEVAATLGWRSTPNALRRAVRRYEARLNLRSYRGMSSNGRRAAADGAARGRLAQASGKESLCSIATAPALG